MKNIFLLYILLFSSLALSAQGVTLSLQGSKDCDLNRYCVEILLRADTDEVLEIGTSSLLLEYNADALAFHNYTPGRFNGDDDCTSTGINAWATHEYDAYSKPGFFNLTLLLDQDGESCPSVLYHAPVNIGVICFDVLQQGGDPSLVFDENHTHFNSADPNNGLGAIPVVDYPVLIGETDLACDCPGAGLPCDDHNVYTVEDRYDTDCNCLGQYLDSDGDGIPDGIDPCQNKVYEAESGTYFGVDLGNSTPRYFGNAYVDFGNDSEDFFEVEVMAEETGTYELAFRYTSNNITRQLELFIDGASQGILYFPETIDWSDWQIMTIDQYLEAGAHTIRLAHSSLGGPTVDHLVLSICNGCAEAGTPCDDGDPCTIEDVLDKDCQCGGRFVDEDGDQVADICDPHLGTAENFPIELGLLRAVGDDWQTVFLESTYDSMVVIATPHLPNKYALPVITRVRQASGNSFQVRVQNPSGPVNQDYAVYYVVAEAGSYQESYDGIKMEARLEQAESTAGAGSWLPNLEQRSFRQFYENPVVLGQVMSDNNDAWSVFWASSASHPKNPPAMNDFAAGKHKAEDFHTERVPETIGMIIIEGGQYELRGRVVEAGVGPDAVNGPNNSGYTYSLNSDLPSGAVLSAAGVNGGNGYWPVLFGDDPVTPGQIRLVVDEDQIKDDERNHISESIAYLAFEAPICRYDEDEDGVCDSEDQCPGNNDLADADNDGIPDACDNCDNSLTGRPCDDGQECTILDVYTADCGCVGIPMDSDGDGVCNWEDICENGDDNLDTDNDGIPDACDPNVGDASTMPIETGVVLGQSDDWQTITLQGYYESPVVIATVRLPDMDHPPVVTRVRNASGNSFELKVQNPSGSIDQQYDVYYFVVEEGQYRAEHDGVQLEARRMTATEVAGSGLWWSAREERTALQNYNQPVVLGQVMSENDPRWSVFWASSGNNSTTAPESGNLAFGKHVGADIIQERSAETIGVIIMETGTYNLRGILLEGRIGEESIGGSYSEGDYITSINAPKGAVLSSAGIIGEGCWPVLFGESPLQTDRFTLMVDEDQISDFERGHTTERVAYIAFDDTNANNQALNKPSLEPTAVNANTQERAPSVVPEATLHAVRKNLSAFPNPVYAKLNVEASLQEGALPVLQIIDLQGRIRLTRVWSQSPGAKLQETLDLSQLETGLYFLRLLDGEQVETLQLVKVGEQ
ncbi:T9SS type A sorting domain-containing protein [Phaeodactylibacter sp.]|uniref:T9SS type A sorting domain-containing protein n=1 Tax=Phaeodactylibacter sp. TaxID=1940289 RepID=UPI0025DA7F4F|nr:T9SS type A sorting domain-containing protein [Phaeodactylibacter sp.]MCI4649108.1 T9SS type A sorting domain-containing protein [Phaeodactylibacter sp.]MCI5091509.1 T9SS type A sorting domain-containing protein [Phaeodactylibacter sp.]